jgi:hypothetical protein
MKTSSYASLTDVGVSAVMVVVLAATFALMQSAEYSV